MMIAIVCRYNQLEFYFEGLNYRLKFLILRHPKIRTEPIHAWHSQPNFDGGSMFSKKPKPSSADQKRELDIALGELKGRYQVLMNHMNNIPETPDMFDANDENLRKSLLDQREAYSNVKTSLTIIQACIQDTTRFWPEGKHVLSLLMDSSRLMLKVFENALEENYLWDRPNPQDNYSESRRAKIFPENRKLSSESDKKIIEGSELLYQLTGWNLFDFEQD